MSFYCFGNIVKIESIYWELMVIGKVNLVQLLKVHLVCCYYLVIGWKH